MDAQEMRDAEILAWPEKVLQGHIVSTALSLGWKVYHTYDSRRSVPGFPDLVLVHEQHGVVWRELKRQKGARVSADQREWLDGLTAAGEDAAIWRPEDVVSGEVLRVLRGR